MVQHDDHCWLVFNGQAWAIRRINYPLFELWRGYWPLLEFIILDVSEVNWDHYCATAADWLEHYHERLGQRDVGFY